MKTLSDHVLAQRAASGDVQARDLLLTRHYGTIERLCRRLCSDPVFLEDVIQETCIALLRHLGSYRGDAAFTTWAYTIARTHHGRALRSDRRHRARADRLAVHVVGTLAPLDIAGSSHLRAELADALSALSPLDRAVLEHRDVLGCSSSETAAALEISVPAVKTRLHRARARVRLNLDTSEAASIAA